jgi:hypothetical protein
MQTAPSSRAWNSGRSLKRSNWSPWLWLLVIISTFLVADYVVGTGAALACSAAMLISALLHIKVGSPFQVRRVTIRSFWFLSYLAMIFFPGFFTYSIELDPFRRSFLIAIVSVVITVPLGFVLASWFCKFHESETDAFFLKPLEANADPAGVLPLVSALLGVGFVLLVLYLRQVGTVPLFYLLKHPGDYYKLMFLREDSFKLLNSPLMYAFYLARGLLFPFLITVSFGYFLWTRHKQWLNAFLIAGASGIFFASLSLAKTPVAVIFLVLALFAYYYRHGSFSYKFVLFSSAIIFAFPLLVMYGVAQDKVGLGTLLQALFDRLILGPSWDVYSYFEFFPAHRAYLHGASTHALASLFGMPVVNSANLVGLYQEPYGLGSINANGAFISDLHADFGLAGVLIGGVLTGVTMQLFHIYLVRRRKTVVTIATYAFLVYAFWLLNSMSLPPILASGGALPVLGLLWLVDGKLWPNWFSKNLYRPLAGEGYLRARGRGN